jgi:hypothetical protein
VDSWPAIQATQADYAAIRVQGGPQRLAGALAIVEILSHGVCRPRAVHRGGHPDQPCERPGDVRGAGTSAPHLAALIGVCAS